MYLFLDDELEKNSLTANWWLIGTEMLKRKHQWLFIRYHEFTGEN